jgi:hypothetical protein
MRGTGEFLEVVERQRHFLVERDRLAATLAKQEVRANHIKQNADIAIALTFAS